VGSGRTGAGVVIVTVVYWFVRDMAAARRCQRCEGGGAERHGADAGKTCPRCNGTGVKPEGWAYDSGGLTLRVGDIVEVPKTPRTRGTRQLATVVEVDVDYPNPKSTVVQMVTPA
jgi:hypothetical protein